MTPDPQKLLALFSALDLAALALLLVGWAASGLVIEQRRTDRLSVNELMLGYRQAWMQQMVRREVRIFDANILSMLREGTSFFASACMIAIGGGVALLGQADRLAGIATDLSVAAMVPQVVWEAKILLIVVILASAFLKFVWAHRLFGYCAVVMAAVPQEDTEAARRMAARAAEINAAAARNFNRGLRAVYFALAALAWLLGPLPLALAVVITLFTLWRREYGSASRSALLRD